MSETASNEQMAVVIDSIANLCDAVEFLCKEQQKLGQSVAELSGVLAKQGEVLNALSQGQTSSAERLKALAALNGMIFLSTNERVGIPEEVWNDPVFDTFLDVYPIDGPAIVGAREMRGLVEQMEKQDRATLAAAFEAAKVATGLSKYARVRNAQLERIAREKSWLVEKDKGLEAPDPGVER